MKKYFSLALKTFLFFVLILYSFTAFTQSKTIDSLKKVLQTQKEDTNKVNTLNGIIRAYINENGDYKNALQYGEVAIALAKKTNFKNGLGNVYQSIGWIYSRQLNYSEAH